MTPPIYAGFEGARLHWNAHDTLIQTRHTPDLNMRGNYRHALERGATGFRDTLPERFNSRDRWQAARDVAGRRLIVWSALHFDQPVDPIQHVRYLAGRVLTHESDRLIAFNEPSIGRDLTGYNRDQAMALALDMMQSALRENPSLRFWTCDPAHYNARETWQVTDELVSFFGPEEIEVVGINYHACWAVEPLRDILRAAAGRYPDRRIAITETSWHDGLPEAESRFPGIRSRQEWWAHVRREVEESGIEVACITWAPWLDMSWEPGDPWPNGFAE